jgi:hypothetical protein
MELKTVLRAHGSARCCAKYTALLVLATTSLSIKTAVDINTFHRWPGELMQENIVIGLLPVGVTCRDQEKVLIAADNSS